MLALNFKILGALAILVLSLTEFLVFNEEVFLFVCFFIFFNVCASLGGKALGDSFQSIGYEFEKDFLQSSQQAKAAVLLLSSSKKNVLKTVSRVVYFLHIFKFIALQKSTLCVLNSFVQASRFYTSALSVFGSNRSQESISQSSRLIFSILAKKELESFVISSNKTNLGSSLSVLKNFKSLGI